MTSSKINIDSRTCPWFRYRPWSFLCEVCMFSTSPCGSSVFHPQSTHMHARWTVDYLWLRVSWRPPVLWRLMICLRRSSDFHWCILGKVAALCSLFVHMFLHRFCTWILHEVSILSVGGFFCFFKKGFARQLFLIFFPSFFNEVFYEPVLQVRHQVMKWFWSMGKPGNILGIFGPMIINRCGVVLGALLFFKEFWQNSVTS